MRYGFSLVALLWVACAWGQQAQNPSPMVEHTRSHPRLKKPEPSLAGKREKLAVGSVFVPARLVGKRSLPLFVHFHGGPWVPELAAEKLGMAVITVDTGSGSGVYARQFTDRALFGKMLDEAAAKAGIAFSSVWLTGWSAGHGAIREILAVPDYYQRVSGVLLIDGMHTGYDGGKPGPLESKLERDHLDTFLQFAREAVAGKKAFLITHSEIFPGTFASTTETADWLLAQLGVQRHAVLKWGPMGTQQLSEARAGGFRMIGYAGNSAPDHVDQLHSLANYISWLRALRPR